MHNIITSIYISTTTTTTLNLIIYMQNIALEQNIVAQENGIH